MIHYHLSHDAFTREDGSKFINRRNEEHERRAVKAIRIRREQNSVQIQSR